MAASPDLKVTSEMLWQAAVIFFVVDAVLAFLLTRRTTPVFFRELKWTLVITTTIFWGLLWLSMSTFFWEPVYHYVFPEWSRWFIPPLYGIFFGIVGFFFWWIVLRMPGNTVVEFLLAGGMWGTVTHCWAVGRGLLEKPPMLQGVSTLSAVVMPFFEFMFYWSVILGIASLIQSGRQKRKLAPHVHLQTAR